jgi:hypothetical protein
MNASSNKFEFQLLDFGEIQVKVQASDCMAGGGGTGASHIGRGTFVHLFTFRICNQSQASSKQNCYRT